ncbi:MAG TPA: hypothetical protein VIY56_17075 [Vicinamibacterales bacterium]
MYFDLLEKPGPLSETIAVSLRKVSVAPQAIEFKVDATRIQFEVHAELVSSNTNALRRFHFFYEVTFTDDLQTVGGITWPDEVVFFTDDGMSVTLPFHWGDDEFVTFTEDQFKINFAINTAEFVTLADYSVQYILDFLSIETLRFTDLSVAWKGVQRWDESVFVNDGIAMTGGNTVALSESVAISEVMIGGPDVAFSDAVFWAEFLFYVMDFQVQPDSVVWVDALVVSEVAATDARPGAFIPGAALLGSPQ